MYPSAELLNQVQQQVLAEFSDQITYFEWFYEQEFTAIMVEIRSIGMDIPVADRIRQIVNAIVGDQYIVSICVSPIESVGCTDGLFNLTYNGGINVFFIEYYAPERPRTNPFKLSAFYTKMFEAVRTIHFDSAEQLWRRLVNFARQAYAKEQGVTSFREDVLAEPLRDFLIEHLDFIKHIAEAVREPLHIFEPAPPPIKPHSSTTNGMQQQHKLVPEGVQAALNKLDPNSPVYAAFSLIQTEEQRQELLALLTQNSQSAPVAEPVAAA
ncbi:MAG: hypothetical protein ACPGWR_26135 [Ardenticatenaceae bacterium]